MNGDGPFRDLSTLVNARRVAVVGASDRPGSMGNSTYLNVRDHSPDVEAFPVNARQPKVCGDIAYARVSEIPGGPVDVAIVLVGAEHVAEVVEDCARAGVSHLMVLSSGFSELGEAGRELQREMVAVARAAGMNVYGPNSPGLANVADRVLLSMSPVASADITPGPIGLVTQGGGVGRALMQWMDLGLGIGLWASPGNESDLDVSDFINHMLDDPRIKVVAAVVEGFSDGAKFIEVAKRARQVGKPIVLMKIGRSAYGQQSAASHTASLAGDDAVADGVFQQFGVIRVEDVDQLAEVAALAARCVDPTRIGSVCVYSFSGGAASHGADLVGAAGLSLAVLDEPTRKVIDEVAPAFGILNNPIDLTTQVFTDSELNRSVLRAVANDPAVGSVLFIMPADYGQSTVNVTKEAIEVLRDTDVTLIPVWMSPRRGGGYDELTQNGLVPFTSVKGAVDAIRCIATWAGAGSEPGPDASPAPAHGSTHTPRPAMAGLASRRLLEARGIVFPVEVLARSEDDLVAAVASFSGPTALKLVAPGVQHKTDVGGVRLGVSTAAAAREAWSAMCGQSAVHTLGVKPDGVAVQEMVDDGIDVLVGAHLDEVFGPVLTIGTGGIYTELEQDVAHLSMPAPPESIERALRGLRVWGRLAGTRGQRAAELAPVLESVAALQTAFLDHAWSECEINPLRVVTSDKGTRCVALDVLIIDRDW